MALLRASTDDEDRINEDSVRVAFGWFCHMLTPARVTVLADVGVNQPQEPHGVQVYDLDPGGAWRISLAKRLTGSGFAVDLNQILNIA